MADGYFRPGSGMLAGYTLDYGTYSAYVQKVSLVDSAGAAVSFGGSGASSQSVQGAGAHAAASVGNPVLVAGTYLSATPNLSNGQTGGVQMDTRSNVKASIFDANGTTGLSIVAASADGVAAASANGAAARALGYGYNGTSWDRLRGDTNGLVTQAFALTGSRWQYAGVTGGITDTSDAVLAAAAGASVRNYVTAIQFINTSATASEIVIKDGSTVIWRGYAAASMAAMQSITFPVPLKGTANTAMNIALLTTATATRVSAQGYTGS